MSRIFSSEQQLNELLRKSEYVAQGRVYYTIGIYIKK